MTAHSTLDIKLLGREFRVVCPPEEREALLAAAALLEDEMSQIAKATKSTGERLAVMAALNLAHRVNASKENPAPSSEPADLKRRITHLEARLEAILAPQEDLF